MLKPISFQRPLADQRPFEKTALADIDQYIDKHDAQFQYGSLHARWLETDYPGDEQYLCVLISIPYYGGGIGVYGYGIYIAMPERLFGAETEHYVFGGRINLSRNEELYAAESSSNGSRFVDLTTMFQGHVGQIFAFYDQETQYKEIYKPLDFKPMQPS